MLMFSLVNKTMITFFISCNVAQPFQSIIPMSVFQLPPRVQVFILLIYTVCAAVCIYITLQQLQMNALQLHLWIHYLSKQVFSSFNEVKIGLLRKKNCQRVIG